MRALCVIILTIRSISRGGEMKKSTRIFVVVVVALMCAACLLAVACSDDVNLKQPKPMEDYIAEATNSIAAAIEKGTDGGTIGMSVSGNMSVDGVSSGQ